ncbi:type VI secretion system tip protein VgrG [Bermanella marisrubri]|uniref:Type VI secretion system tip protein VgrG n=1 Tax=Bermanella marisrubri TaxID=207949 RepID=Q1N523_9GAMM|nr:type VI secretion system tip protein TssI/VgrG [Bermanella marisrubri]EAT13255.1 hypothetical protein RED65_00805 [Oceanobacter sp. RED65] [Bermanella marisrubri]QIZ84022.1 type VI secretion system tip protein VgrG [Bermanella marisrubri]
MAQPVFKIASASFPSELEITAMEGTESISHFFELNIHFKVAKDTASTMDHSILTQEDITLTIDSNDNEEKDPYQIIGVFSSVEEVFEQSNTHKFYIAKMVPALWRQRNNQSYDIYTDQTAKDILTDELSNDLMLDHHFALTGNYPKKEFICQYSESNFNFVSRLAEHWGIYYYFDHYQGGRLVFADDTNYEDLPVSPVKLDETNNPTNSFDTVRTLRRVYNAVPDSVIITETNPDQAMELFQGIAGDVQDGKTNVNMADEGADNKDEAEFLAKIRLEEMQAYKTVFSGTTGLPCITPGFVLSVETPSGDIHDILITEVQHSGSNLDQGAKSASAGTSPYYECSFKGIPKDTQYRPERRTDIPSVISTTGRVYSAANDQTLAQRNEVGKYQVTFDFMRGQEEKISNWIRHASHSARSNHLDIPLTPGTEVQIGFIAGNPNRPYIMNALENSQSVLHPVTHENPHHAALITDGMLYTGALKSRQSLHMTANLDPANVKEHIKQHELKELDSLGADQGSPVDTIKGDAHIERTYGNRYQWREGVDFNYGLNATYNFGQQYVENHAYQDNSKGEEFDVSDKLDSFDQSVASIVRSDLQKGLSDEREVGFIKKDFGNKYNYHQGVERNWGKGIDGNGQHVTINFGGRYIENQLKTDSGMPDTSGINGKVSDKTLAIKTVGDEARYNEGVIDVHHKGEMKHVQTGNHTSEITGDVSEKITGNFSQEIMGDLSIKCIAEKKETNNTISGDETETNIVAGKVSKQTQAATEISSIEMTPSKKATISGNEDWFNLAMKSQMVAGLINENFVGGKLTTTAALLTDILLAGKITNNKVYEIENGKLKTDKKQTVINQYKVTNITKTNINVVNAKITMVG